MTKMTKQKKNKRKMSTLVTDRLFLILLGTPRSRTLAIPDTRSTCFNKNRHNSQNFKNCWSLTAKNTNKTMPSPLRFIKL